MSASLLSCFCNGIEVSAIAATSRAFHYGDGVFRTLLRHRGQVLDAAAQIEKLIVDAAGLGLEASPSLHAQLLGEVDRVAEEVGTAVIKLMLVRGGAGRGYVPDNVPSDRYVLGYRPPRYPAQFWSEGIVLHRSAFVLGDQPALAGIKHLNRLEQVLAYRSASPDAQEVLLRNARGEWICGGRTNVFVVRDGVLLTPGLDRQGVSGRMRERVLQAAGPLGIDYRIGPVTETCLDGADEMFVTNSVIGIWPVRELDGRAFDAPGPVSRRLSQALEHPRLA